jgi:hypothetical protein
MCLPYFPVIVKHIKRIIHKPVHSILDGKRNIGFQQNGFESYQEYYYGIGLVNIKPSEWDIIEENSTENKKKDKETELKALIDILRCNSNANDKHKSKTG